VAEGQWLSPKERIERGKVHLRMYHETGDLAEQADSRLRYNYMHRFLHHHYEFYQKDMVPHHHANDDFGQWEAFGEPKKIKRTFPGKRKEVAASR
jgi:hypothetical protein